MGSVRSGCRRLDMDGVGEAMSRILHGVIHPTDSRIEKRRMLYMIRNAVKRGWIVYVEMEEVEDG